MVQLPGALAALGPVRGPVLRRFVAARSGRVQGAHGAAVRGEGHRDLLPGHSDGVGADDHGALGRRAQEDLEDTAEGLAPAFRGHLAEVRVPANSIGHGRLKRLQGCRPAGRGGLLLLPRPLLVGCLALLLLLLAAPLFGQALAEVFKRHVRVVEPGGGRPGVADDVTSLQVQEEGVRGLVPVGLGAAGPYGAIGVVGKPSDLEEARHELPDLDVGGRLGDDVRAHVLPLGVPRDPRGPPPPAGGGARSVASVPAPMRRGAGLRLRPGPRSGSAPWGGWCRRPSVSLCLPGSCVS